MKFGQNITYYHINVLEKMVTALAVFIVNSMQRELRTEMLHTVQIIKWYTTPKELRNIADKMEQQWGKAILGDNNLITTIFGKTEYIEIRYDQERMGNK
jgi:hypothetical protein